MPYAANAAGLGKLTVFSGLGEPLNAEIELSATKDELSSLTAKIASSDTYNEQGLQRPAILGNLLMEVGRQANGNPVLKLSSPAPIDDPFLDMLIQVEWSNGRLLREYTALLDPPGFGEKADAVAKPPQVAAESAGVTPSGKAAPKSGKGKTGAGKPVASQAPQGDEYKTRSGDTLRSIAKEMQIEGVSLDQMLVGLYRANQDAFVNGNMNRLKTGQILRVPSSEEIQSLTQQEAVKEIRVHASDWNAYRQKLAGAVTDAEGESAQAQSASGKITAPAEDKGAKAPEGPRDVVKLSKGDVTGKATGPETAAVAKDDAVAQQKASKEADARIASLEKQLQDMQKLLEVKNRDLASLQKPAAGQASPAPAPVPAPAPAATAPAPEIKPAPPTPAEEAKPVEAKPVEAPPVAAETKPAEPPKTKRVKRPPPVFDQPAAEPDLLEDPLVMGGVGGGLIALLAGGWLYLRNKRRKGLDSFEQGILTTSGLKPNTVFGNTAGGMVDTGDTSFLTDLSQGGGGMIDTNDVDPIAEAEVYMAYGRDVQAEEILKDAIVKEPRRYELHQKLLEIYANRKDTTAFETLAGELYATLGPTDATWQKFAAMGHALEPSNPLYVSNGAAVASEASSAASTQEFPAASFSATNMEHAEVVDTGADQGFDSLQPVVADNGLDFDLGGIEAPAEDITEAAEPASESVVLEMPEPVSESPISENAPSLDQGLDFSFELPEPALEENVQLGAAEIGLESAGPEGSESFAGLDSLPELEIPGNVVVPPVAESAESDISLDLPELDVDSMSSSAGGGESTDVVAEAVTEAALELPESVFEEVAPVAEEAVADNEFAVPEISFDLSDASTVEAEPAAETLDTAELELPSLDMETVQAEDMDKTMVFQAPVSPAEEIVFESAPSEEAALDFNFDTEFAAPAEEAVELATETAASGLPDLDLSGISLELDEPAAEAGSVGDENVALELPEVEDIVLDAVAAEAPAQFDEAALEAEAVEEITLSGSESADVDTKLDLVAAYMDMGDTEGARELLEEVLREGGPQQRERAQGLLDSLS